MEYQRKDNFFFLRLERGEEITQAVKALCKRENIIAATVSGIGATDCVTVGLYDTKEKQYVANTYTKDMEITSLSGNISQKDGEEYLHLHITVADSSNKVLGGHLTHCIVSVTAEIVITAFPVETNRVRDKDTGINLLHFPKGTVLK